MDNQPPESIEWSEPFDKEVAARMQSVARKFFLRPLPLRIKVLCAMVLVFIVACLLVKEHVFWYRLLEPFAIFSGLLLAGAVFQYYTIRNGLSRKQERDFDKLEQRQAIMSFSFSEKGITIDNGEKKKHWKWGRLRHYSFFDDYLVIGVVSMSNLNIFICPGDGLSQQNYERIVELTKSKLPFHQYGRR